MKDVEQKVEAAEQSNVNEIANTEEKCSQETIT